MNCIFSFNCAFCSTFSSSFFLCRFGIIVHIAYQFVMRSPDCEENVRRKHVNTKKTRNTQIEQIPNTELLVVSQTSPMPHSFGTLRAFALEGLFGKKLVPSNCGNGCKHATRNHMQHQNETAKEKILRSHLIHTLYHQNSSKFLCTVT